MDLFERQFNVSILVIIYEDKHFFPIRVPSEKRDTEIHLLLLKKINLNHDQPIPSSGSQISTTSHYVAVRNLAGLLSNHNKIESICTYCLRTPSIAKCIHEKTCGALFKKRMTFPNNRWYTFRKLANSLDIA
jgi:hypothetical protein